MALKENTTGIASLVEHILASILEITVSVVSIEIEQESFIEVGCYLYRASLAIHELLTTKHCPTNEMEILQPISESIDLAKDLVVNFAIGTHSSRNLQLRGIMVQLQEVIRNIGKCLSMILSSTLQDQEYAEIAIKSLSNEMQHVTVDIAEMQASETNELGTKILSSGKQPKEEPAPTETNVYFLDVEISMDDPETKELGTKILSSGKQPKEEPAPIETDLYSLDVELSTDDPKFLDTCHIIKVSKSASYACEEKYANMSRSLTALPEVAQYMEPLYETFLCPLTKKLMNDPVTIESGVTYERKAINEWFGNFSNPDEIICPTTREKLPNRVFKTNIALKSTIAEWKERNEASRIKVARAALSLASSDSMVLEAIKDLLSVSQRNQYTKSQGSIIGMLPLLIKFLEYNDKNVMCATLELLQQLAEDDNDLKEMIAKIIDVSTIIKMLSSSHQPLKHSALTLLLQLSRSQYLCERIGSVTGGILMLITTKYKRSSDAFAAEKADKILKNLERSPYNIKCMAENGLLEPLLNHLIEGCDEMKMEMASYLGEIVLGHGSKTYVAQRASAALIEMVHSGNTLSRSSAFKALVQISSYQPNSKILVEAGIVQIMVGEMFTRQIYNEPMNSKAEAAAILANIFESGLPINNIQVNVQGHTMTSDYVVYNIICMLKNSSPDELNIGLIRILLCLAKIPKSITALVSALKHTESCYFLLELIDSPHEELIIATVKLLITLSSYIGHTLSDMLCKSSGQPENLILRPAGITQITERQAVSANFLAKLPHQNTTLNLALLNKNIVPEILQAISKIQRSGTRSGRYANNYLEGLVGILIRFTRTLYEPQILLLARTFNFTKTFTELLVKTSSDEVLRLAANGLENLSSESVNLSKPSEVRRSKSKKWFHFPKLPSFNSSKGRNSTCPIHRGACSSQNTFCLVDADAVPRLSGCLDHENVEVVEAALSAICTLLDEKVDVEKSVSMLTENNTIQHVLNLINQHREVGLQQKCFWVIERFLMRGGEKSVSDISQDKLLPATLVSAFHHGDGNSRQMAEKILRRLNKMPKFSSIIYTM
ncbi:RING-type E3 ubiquitin transferase [Quillaja saponaria]|uniref:RING-type E3 ubiquitin transferase n=1 Tax=Quillaja saponaria TaxID=32244 RepID=A0AAD7KNR9_QUISA|nr:RING-type E3 ubiquitin transferase [Quillaja saponaria]